MMDFGRLMKRKRENYMFEQDYIMRLIHEMVRTVMKLVFGLDEEDEEEVKLLDTLAADEGGKLNELLDLADAGKINEAENQLYDILDKNDANTLKMALLFYNHINEYDGEFLDKADYSRDEIRDGICNVLEQFGYGGMTGLFMQ